MSSLRADHVYVCVRVFVCVSVSVYVSVCLSKRNGSAGISAEKVNLMKESEFCSFALFVRLPQLTAAIELVSEISKQLTERKNEAVTEINATFEELERALQQRKSALITDLENICNAKQKVQ